MIDTTSCKTVPEACRQIERKNSDADAVNNVPVGPFPRTPKKANIDIDLADLRKQKELSKSIQKISSDVGRLAVRLDEAESNIVGNVQNQAKACRFQSQANHEVQVQKLEGLEARLVSELKKEISRLEAKMTPMKATRKSNSAVPDVVSTERNQSARVSFSAESASHSQITNDLDSKFVVALNKLKQKQSTVEKENLNLHQHNASLETQIKHKDDQIRALTSPTPLAKRQATPTPTTHTARELRAAELHIQQTRQRRLEDAQGRSGLDARSDLVLHRRRSRRLRLQKSDHN